jgi:hypothetical protein
MEELGNLLNWLHPKLGLSYLARNTLAVDAILPGLTNEDRSLSGFYVYVPYDIAKKVMMQASVEQSFAPIKLGEK